jgi:hypothetical protein
MGMYEKHAPKQAVYEITAIEEDILSQLADIVYATGDIFYYDGLDIVKLAAGSDGQHLVISGGIPIWDEIPSGMVYPGVGIPLSTGIAWGTSIINNSTNWNIAFGWGNHAIAGYVTGTPWTSEGYLTSLSGALLATGATTGATSQAQAFTNGIVSPTIDGSTAANGDITIQGTTNATRTTSYVNLQPNGGNVGIGTTGPTSKLHLAAGTATAGTAPLGFTSGTLLTVPVVGKVEFLTDAWYGTITTGAARKTFAFLESPSFTTPSLGVATATTINGLTITANGTNTLNITAGKTLAVSDSATIATNAITLAGGEVITFTATNALTLATTGATSVTLPTTGTLVSSVTTGNGVSATNTAGALAFTLGAITPTTVNEATILSNSSSFNTQLGHEAGLNLVAGAERNTFVGKGTGKMGAGTSNTADSNTGVGAFALTALTVGESNTAIGGSANVGLTSGVKNTSVGTSAMASLVTGNLNTAIGYQALYSPNTSASTNTAIGAFSLRSVETSGSGNVALGYYSGYYETGSDSFYVDNQNRTDTAGDKAGALLYGTFNATPASQTLKVNGTLSVLSGIIPVTNDGMAIGTTALGVSDLFLASGGVINWANGNTSLTQSSTVLTLNAGSVFKADHLSETTAGHGVIFGNNVGILASPSAAQGLKVGAGWSSGSSVSIVSVISDVAVDVDATNHAIAYQTAAFLANIASTKTDSGYRKGYDLRMIISDANFEGTLSSIIGLDCWAGIYSGTGTVTESIAIKASRFYKTGTVTNSYGIMITAPTTGGTAINSWAFYSADTAPSLFSGRLDITNGNHLMVGGATVEAGSTNTIGIANGTAPDAHVDNQVLIFSADTADATATLGLYLEQAVVAEAVGASDATLKININGTVYKVLLKA